MAPFLPLLPPPFTLEGMYVQRGGRGGEGDHIVAIRRLGRISKCPHTMSSRARTQGIVPTNIIRSIISVRTKWETWGGEGRRWSETKGDRGQGWQRVCVCNERQKSGVNELHEAETTMERDVWSGSGCDRQILAQRQGGERSLRWVYLLFKHSCRNV